MNFNNAQKSWLSSMRVWNFELRSNLMRLERMAKLRRFLSPQIAELILS